MSSTITSVPPRARAPRPSQVALRRRPAAPAFPEGDAVPARSRHGRGGRVLFAVPFHSELSDAELARLARLLDLSTHMYPKQRPDPTSPGVARLDHFSGLYLERGASDGDWLLEARTWGRPAPESVHEWHLLAADAARALDPSVRRPERLQTSVPHVHDLPVGQVANRRAAAFGRDLVGLP